MLVYDLDNGEEFVFRGERFTLISIDDYGTAKVLDKYGNETNFNANAEISTEEQSSFSQWAEHKLCPFTDASIRQ